MDRERDRRGRQLRDHVDVLDIVPAPRDRARQIRLVLVVGGDELDLLTEHLAAKIFDRHPGRFDRPFAAVVCIDAGLVVEDADLDALRGGRCCQQQGRGCDGGQKG
ncbi:hypothetical protein ACVJMY_001739 [Bradyrhizobium diazoefficiens]